ncbi:MAG: hypothetical protein V3V49_04610 [Candidatus Krumholzibacteria bacterium]
MGLEFLQRVRRTAVITGLILFPFITLYLGLAAGVAWVLGVAWSLVNIYFIGLLVRFTYVDGKKQRLRPALGLLVKVPVLYFVGFLLLRSSLPDLGLLAGFTWPLSVIALKSAARLILKLDDPNHTALNARPNLIRKSR